MIVKSCLLDDLSEINKKILLIELSEKFPDIYRFCNRDPNKFSLLLRKGVCPYEYMDSWERFDETELPDKESFYSELNKRVLQMKIMYIYKKYEMYLK